MKHVLTFLLLLCVSRSYSQNDCTHPPRLFNSGDNLCDNRNLQLVFYEEFNGDSLKAPWQTFTSWAGMQPHEHANWSAARGNEDDIFTYLDKNVVVSNGTVKLQVHKEYNYWQCDTCLTGRTRNFTGSTLCLPFYDKNGRSYMLNSGYVEARLKMPVFKSAHSCFWTWKAGPENVNEIDIAEAYGRDGLGLDPFMYPFINQPINTYTTHAWWENYKKPVVCLNE